MKNKEIAKKCGDSMILSGHRNIGSSEFKQMSFFGLPVDKMFWSSEDIVRAHFHYAESRQNKP